MLELTIDWKRVEVEFMEEKITAEVRPLSNAHMLVISPHLNFDMKKKLSDSEASQKVLELQKAAAPILADVVRDIKGISINGKPVDPILLGTESALCALASQLISQAVIATQLDRASEKNSQSPPAGRSPGQIAEV